MRDAGSRDRISILLCAAALFAPLAAAGEAAPARPSPVAVFVQLSESPVTRPGAAGKEQYRRVIAEQDRFMTALNSAGVNATILYRVHRALNGVALTVPADKIDVLRNLPGVRTVRVMEPQHLNGARPDSPAPAPKRVCPGTGAGTN